MPTAKLPDETPKCPIVEEVAAILAKGFLRLRGRYPKLEARDSNTKDSDQFTEKELDSSGDQSLHCDVG